MVWVCFHVLPSSVSRIPCDMNNHEVFVNPLKFNRAYNTIKFQNYVKNGKLLSKPITPILVWNVDNSVFRNLETDVNNKGRLQKSFFLFIYLIFFLQRYGVMIFLPLPVRFSCGNVRTQKTTIRQNFKNFSSVCDLNCYRQNKLLMFLETATNHKKIIRFRYLY